MASEAMEAMEVASDPLSLSGGSSQVSNGDGGAPRGRGRPRKQLSPGEVAKVPKARGRPRKSPKPGEEAKSPRGRPKKEAVMTLDSDGSENGVARAASSDLFGSSGEEEVQGRVGLTPGKWK